MLLGSGYVNGARVVHLTHTTLLVEGLCGEAVGFDGSPDLGVICEECLEAALAAGADVSTFVLLEESPRLVLLAA